MKIQGFSKDFIRTLKNALRPQRLQQIQVNGSAEAEARGFSLLELLIVIAIIALLAVALILVLNPAETLKKSRDTQRISDLSTIKTAIGVYLTTVSSPDLDDAQTTFCFTNTTGTASTTEQISYSKDVANPECTGGAALTGGADADSEGWAADYCTTVSGTVSEVDGDGWIPVDMTAVKGGSPISSFPTDPTNTIATDTTPAATDFVYRYACQNKAATAGKPSYVYEVDAQLESDAYTVDDNKESKDGGDNAVYYETGNSLFLLPTEATGW